MVGRPRPRSWLTGAGEVYVLDDGGEVDLDLGNYERYLNVTLTRDNNITTGKIYSRIIDKEVGARIPVRCMLTGPATWRLFGQDGAGRAARDK